MEESDKQNDNKPWLWKKGQSGNLKGRPKGKTLKEYARDYLSKMTDEERDEWLEGISKDKIWTMAEGLPQQDITSGGEVIKPTPIINVFRNNSNTKDNSDVQEVKDCTGGNVCKQDNKHTTILDSIKSE